MSVIWGKGTGFMFLDTLVTKLYLKHSRKAQKMSRVKLLDNVLSQFSEEKSSLKRMPNFAWTSRFVRTSQVELCAYIEAYVGVEFDGDVVLMKPSTFSYPITCVIFRRLEMELKQKISRYNMLRRNHIDYTNGFYRYLNKLSTD